MYMKIDCYFLKATYNTNPTNLIQQQKATKIEPQIANE